MNWKTAQDIEDNKYNLPGDWLKMEYFEALNILFRIENALRIFVYIVLKNKFQDKWKDLSITSDDEESSTISAIAKKRISQDKNYAYLGFEINSPLLHLTSGELIRIVTSESYWKFFKNYFLGTKEIMKNKLDEIGNVRNSVAHFRPIKKGDIELIKQNSIHTLSEVEKTIVDLINCVDTVPTNTEDTWYKETVTIGTELCTLKFKQSQNEEWVRIILLFNCSNNSGQKYGVGYTFKTFNIKVNNLLNEYRELSKLAICITENNPYLYTKTPETSIISKEIKFTFSKECVDKFYPVLKAEFEKVVLQISNEFTLIKEDNLARGKIVESFTCSFTKNRDSEFFELKNERFYTTPTQFTPVEFWGTLNHASRNFITATDTYPWMPVVISEDKDALF